MPLLTSALIVKIDRSFKDSLFSLDHTSPNNTSSLSSANFGANSPRLSLPAVCFLKATLFFLLIDSYIL